MSQSGPEEILVDRTSTDDDDNNDDKQGIAWADAVCESSVEKKGEGSSGLNNTQPLTDKLVELASAGWKPKLKLSESGQQRRRIVYESPQGIQYDTITKAYEMFQEHRERDIEPVLSEDNCDLSDSSSCDILDETLSKMKREVVNKRRRIDDEEDQVRSKKLTNVPSGKERKRTILSWMIEMGFVPLNEKVKSMNKDGEIIEDGILCSCCKQVLSVSEFGKHAGRKLHQEYEYILVEQSGTSLLQCLRDAWKNLNKSDRHGFYTVATRADDPSDDRCGFCGDYCAPIRCAGCYSTFHESCLGMEGLPPSHWYCSTCCCKFCRLFSEPYSMESGVVVPPIPCDQCQEKYHKKCSLDDDGSFSISNGSTAMFCGKSCTKNFERLQELLGIKKDMDEIKKDMDAGFSWRLVRRLPEDSSLSKKTRGECNAKIALALEVMEECFSPIIAHRRGISLIHDVVYNCGIHGTRFAEMPLFAILKKYRCQGMRFRLLNKIESVLCSLGVQKLIRHATSKPKDSWTTVFGFKPLVKEDEDKPWNMIVFPGRGLLQKPLEELHLVQPISEASMDDWERWKADGRHVSIVLHKDFFCASLDQTTSTSGWERLMLDSHDQTSDQAEGARACAPLAVVVAHWLLTNEGTMPTKSDFDELILEGSSLWLMLKEMPKYRKRFPDAEFDIDTVVNEAILTLSVAKIEYGAFDPNEASDNIRLKSVLNTQSFDSIWGKISRNWSELTPNGRPLVYIVGWNNHFFVLKLEQNASYIVDTLGSRLEEKCEQGYILKFDETTSISRVLSDGQDENLQGLLSVREGKESCMEYIKSFLVARGIGELEADMNNGVAVADVRIQLCLVFEINRIEIPIPAVELTLT